MNGERETARLADVKAIIARDRDKDAWYVRHRLRQLLEHREPENDVVAVIKAEAFAFDLTSPTFLARTRQSISIAEERRGDQTAARGPGSEAEEAASQLPLA